MLLSALLASMPLRASEGGSSRGMGSDTLRAGMLPPPGLSVFITLAHSDAEHLIDGRGEDLAGVSNFRAQANTVLPRISYVWRDTTLWGAHIETRVGVPIIDLNVRMDRVTAGGTQHREGSTSGPGDFIIGPAFLGWRSERFHQIVGPVFFLATAPFDPAKPSRGRGYDSASLAYFFTWLPVERLEVSGSLWYDANRRNEHTGYRSGNDVSLEYGIARRLNPTWEIGVNGYAYKQVTDDDLPGRVFVDGNRGQVLAIGPWIHYTAGRGQFVSFKWFRETEVRNRSRGDRVSIQFLLPL